MKASSEFLKFDDEDHGNIDYEGGAYPYGIHKAQKDHMLFLCYYEPDPQGNFYAFFSAAYCAWFISHFLYLQMFSFVNFLFMAYKIRKSGLYLVNKTVKDVS